MRARRAIEAGSRSMGTGRADHIRTQYVKNTDKSHERFLSENICDIRSFLSIIPGLKKFKACDNLIIALRYKVFYSFLLGYGRIKQFVIS